MARPMLSAGADPWTPAPLPSDVFAPARIEEPRAPGPMDILPNNLADWPARKSWLHSDSPSGGGMRGRVVGRLVLLIFVGGLLGFGGYHWAVSLDEITSLSPPSVTTPALTTRPRLRRTMWPRWLTPPRPTWTWT
jgi:hypothetical protein